MHRWNSCRQLHYPGDVIGSMFVGPPGRSSFDTRFELYRADDPATLYARGTAKCVWIDYAAAKSVQIPDLLRHAIETAADTPGAQSPSSRCNSSVALPVSYLRMSCDR